MSQGYTRQVPVDDDAALTANSSVLVPSQKAVKSHVASKFPVSLANGGLGVGLTDPNADRILFWDDSAGQFAWLTLDATINITGTTVSASPARGRAYALSRGMQML